MIRRACMEDTCMDWKEDQESEAVSIGLHVRHVLDVDQALLRCRCLG